MERGYDEEETIVENESIENNIPCRFFAKVLPATVLHWRNEMRTSHTRRILAIGEPNGFFCGDGWRASFIHSSRGDTSPLLPLGPHCRRCSVQCITPLEEHIHTRVVPVRPQYMFRLPMELLRVGQPGGTAARRNGLNMGIPREVNNGCSRSYLFQEGRALHSHRSVRPG